MKLVNHLLYPIYYFVFFIYKVILKNTITEVDDVWFRNSLALGYWSFGRSDIDISVSVNCLSDRTGLNILRVHEKIKSCLIIIGELVIVDKSPVVLDSLIQCMNIFELSRDPVLYNYAKNHKEICTSDKIVFIHKFIVSNWPSDKNKTVRREKVDFIYNLLSLDKDQKRTFDNLKNELAKLLGSPFNSSIERLYDDIVKNKTKLTDVPSTPYSLLFFNKLYHGEEVLFETGSVVNSEILIGILKWELWGAFSNRYSLEVYDFKKHITRMLSSAYPLLSRQDFLEVVDLGVNLNLIE